MSESSSSVLNHVVALLGVAATAMFIQRLQTIAKIRRECACSPANAGSRPSAALLEMKDKRASAAEEFTGTLQKDTGISEVFLHELNSLRDHYQSADCSNDCWAATTATGECRVSYNKVVADSDYIVFDIIQKTSKKAQTSAFLRAGPRAKTHFDPSLVTAAVVTCGGLCPGLNNVIRKIVHTLHYQYGARAVWGIRYESHH